MTGVQTFNRGLELDVGDAMREHRAQALFSQFRALAGVAEIVRYQVEALRLRRAVTSEIDHDGVFRLRAFQSVEWTGFKRRWAYVTREPLDRGDDVGFRGILIE